MSDKLERKEHFLVNLYFKKKNKWKIKKQRYFLFLDTETNQEEIKNKLIGHKKYNLVSNSFMMGTFVFYDMLEHKTIRKLTTWDYNSAIKFINKCVYEHNIWIVAHNLIFDATILDLWKVLKSKNYEPDIVHNKGMTFIETFKKKEGTHTKIVTLVNSGNIFPTSLAKIGEAVGFKKLDISFGEYSKEGMEIYNKRDVEILVEFFKQWTDLIYNNSLGNLKFTNPAQCLEAFKKKFCTHWIKILGTESDANKEILNFERSSYFGGRTEIFYKGKIRSKIYDYDVNSMYPYVMKENYFPTEYKFAKYNITPSRLDEYIKKGYLVIAQVKVKTQERCVPIKKNGRLIFPIGTFWATLATPEIKYLLDNNYIIQTSKIQFYNGAKIFSNYIDFFYEKRQELKEEANPMEKMIKLFLNALYGKFGQMNDDWQAISFEDLNKNYPDFSEEKYFMGDVDSLRETIIVNGQILSKYLKVRIIGNQWQIKIKNPGESKDSFPAIASHVTSYARMHLYSYFLDVKKRKGKIYYCDTDSFFTNIKVSNDLVSKTKLGFIKIEKEFKYGAKFNGLKDYDFLNKQGNICVEKDGEEIYIDDLLSEGDFTKIYLSDSKIHKGKTWALKGVSKDAIMLGQNKFLQQEWGGLPKQKYYEKFGKKTNEFWVIDRIKEIKGTITKGVLKSDGKIDPFCLKD